MIGILFKIFFIRLFSLFEILDLKIVFCLMSIFVQFDEGEFLGVKEIVLFLLFMVYLIIFFCRGLFCVFEMCYGLLEFIRFYGFFLEYVFCVFVICLGLSGLCYFGLFFYFFLVIRGMYVVVFVFFCMFFVFVLVVVFLLCYLVFGLFVMFDLFYFGD